MCRRECPLKPSLRDHMIQRALWKLISPTSPVCLFLLWTPSSNPNRSIRSFDYKLFVTDISQTMVASSFSILNHPPTSAEYSSFTPTSDVDCFRVSGFRNQSTMVMPQAKEMEENCRDIVQLLQTKVQHLLQLEHDILEAKSRLQKHRQSSNQK
eukprot:c7240_g1_i1.p1 GENE.c7240_g1_i1~~c7240_g1_i1.p1  ORF type:complete len:154 (-),score=29.83 c7240_g1_i1:14-475(-)